MATYERFTDRELRYIVETEAQFGTNLSGTAAYRQVRSMVGQASITRSREMLKNPLNQTHRVGGEPMIPGRKRVTVSFKMLAYGALNPLSATIVPGTHDGATMLGVMMGGHFAASGSSVSAASASGSATFTSPGIAPNGQIVMLRNAQGKYEAVRVKATAGSVKTFDSTLSFVPSAGDQIYNTHTCYIADHCTGTLQFYQKGKHATDTTIAAGCQGNFSIESVLGALPVLGFDLNGPTWFTGASSAGVNYQTYPSGNAVSHFTDSKVYIWPRSATVAVQPTALKASSLVIKPNLVFTDVESPDGAENVVAKVAMPSDGGIFSIEMKLPMPDLTYLAGMENVTEYGILIQNGSQPGKIFGACFPRVTITSHLGPEDLKGIVGQTVTFTALPDLDTTATTGFDDLARSPGLIFFG